MRIRQIRPWKSSWDIESNFTYHKKILAQIFLDHQKRNRIDERIQGFSGVPINPFVLVLRLNGSFTFIFQVFRHSWNSFSISPINLASYSSLYNRVSKILRLNSGLVLKLAVLYFIGSVKRFWVERGVFQKWRNLFRWRYKLL